MKIASFIFILLINSCQSANKYMNHYEFQLNEKDTIITNFSAHELHRTVSYEFDISNNMFIDFYTDKEVVRFSVMISNDILYLNKCQKNQKIIEWHLFDLKIPEAFLATNNLLSDARLNSNEIHNWYIINSNEAIIVFSENKNGDDYPFLSYISNKNTKKIDFNYKNKAIFPGIYGESMVYFDTNQRLIFFAGDYSPKNTQNIYTYVYDLKNNETQLFYSNIAFLARIPKSKYLIFDFGDTGKISPLIILRKY